MRSKCTTSLIGTLYVISCTLSHFHSLRNIKSIQPSFSGNIFLMVFYKDERDYDKLVPSITNKFYLFQLNYQGVKEYEIQSIESEMWSEDPILSENVIYRFFVDPLAKEIKVILDSEYDFIDKEMVLDFRREKNSDESIRENIVMTEFEKPFVYFHNSKLKVIHKAVEGTKFRSSLKKKRKKEQDFS